MPLIPSPLEALGLRLPTREPFTRAQALDCGVSASQLRRLHAGGAVRRVLHSVYVASEVAESIALRCQALALVLPTDAFVCDRTAAWLYTGPLALGPNEHLGVPEISCFRRSAHRALKGDLVSSGERAVVDSDLRELHGLVVTTELRTALDLGRLQRGRDLRLWGMDNMLATRAFEHEELLSEVARFAGQRGVVMLRALAPLVDPLAESFGESALRLRWYDAGLPRPQLQIPAEVDGREVARMDMGLPEWRFAAEYFGERWHGEEQAEHDGERLAWLESAQRWRIEVLRRQHVFGRLQDAELRLRKAAWEARASIGRRLFVI